jgi:hypothetical protein
LLLKGCGARASLHARLFGREELIVSVAVSPELAHFARRDDRMVGRLEVPGRVAMGR